MKVRACKGFSCGDGDAGSGCAKMHAPVADAMQTAGRVTIVDAPGGLRECNA